MLTGICRFVESVDGSRKDEWSRWVISAWLCVVSTLSSVQCFDADGWLTVRTWSPAVIHRWEVLLCGHGSTLSSTATEGWLKPCLPCFSPVHHFPPYVRILFPLSKIVWLKRCIVSNMGRYTMKHHTGVPCLHCALSGISTVLPFRPS